MKPVRKQCFRGLLAATAMALVACGNPEFTQEDSGSTETFDVGDEFDITLPTNMSAGHSWSVDISTPAVVTLKGTDYDSDSNVAGGVGDMIHTFKCLDAGEATIDMKNSTLQEAVLSSFVLYVIVE